MNIIFIGTSQFAVPCLEKICHTKHKPTLCITKNNHKNKSPVQICAEKYNIKNFNASLIDKTQLQQKIMAEKPELIIVISFGMILPEKILKIPKYGCFNAHASLLPRWRGAAPIQRAIFQGDETTGISIIKMNPVCDAGDIALTQEIKIEKHASTTQMQNKLAIIAADNIIKLLALIEQKKLTLTPQDTNKVSYAEKITAKDRIINFNNSATQINCQIHALAEKPAAYFYAEINGVKENIQIIKAEVIKDKNLCHIETKNLKSTQIIKDKHHHFLIKCNIDALKPILLKRPGKKIIPLKDFLNGLQKSKVKIINPPNT